MKGYDHKKIEKKWQKFWEKKKLYRATEDPKKKKFYSLIEFPYPSGEGLHVGHIRSNTAMDIISRKKRMEGYNVLYPIGWDAFGLPTENYAIKTGIQPKIVTKKNTDTFRRQLQALGFSFDWSREINTTDPAYYKWTQWIFLQFLKQGLAYKKKMAINWCPKDKIGLANEEVIDGKCERCGTPVEERLKEQWMLAITKYADRLFNDLENVDFLPKIKIQQRNWIGRSEGVNFSCQIKDSNIKVEMYNSAPQTYRAETFTVIAPEHPLVEDLVKGTKYEKDVLAFVKKIKQQKSDNTFDIEKDLEGIFTGRYIENYAGRDLPIWVASYVVADYGTGIVNCSAHDVRDFAFAKKYNIPLHEVAEPLIVKTAGEDAIQEEKPFKERRAVVVILRNPKNNSYLTLQWKKINWKGFVIGGIEEGEDAKNAAIRELKEETGYKNVKFIESIGGVVHSKFYQAVKQENRFAHFEAVYLELIDEAKDEIEQKEKDLHDISWMTAEAVETFLNREDMRLIWDRYLGKDNPVIKNGILTEPAEFKGREWNEVRGDIINFIEKKGYGKRAVQYKLRDWVFSRQRYWGEPIPVIHCKNCALSDPAGQGVVPVPEKDLPVKLPNIKDFKPRDDGESPLASVAKWVNVKCPVCKSPAKRETDTMPNWAGSSWYYLRYTDPKNKKAFAGEKNLKYWTPVDWYNGGMEHTTLHLLYSRFWHKFLYDLKLVPTLEPYQKRTSHGLILAEGGVKMSKSKGNVINPDTLVGSVGADSLRVYEMFMGPFEQAISWNSNSVSGSRRFIERVWNLFDKVRPKGGKILNPDLEILLNQTIKKVTEDIEAMKFNTAISQLMILINALDKEEQISKDFYETFLKLVAPFTPHVAEELWSKLGNKKSVHTSTWPEFDKGKLEKNTVSIAVQVNGKIRGVLVAERSLSEAEITKQALALEGVSRFIKGQNIKKIIYIPEKVVNVVV